MRGGIKTKAGKNRIIPINKKILPFIFKRKTEGNKYLIVNHDNKKMSYWNYTKIYTHKDIEELIKAIDLI